MRTSLAFFALFCSGCIFLYSEVDEGTGAHGGQSSQGGGGAGAGMNGGSGQGGAGGTGGAGGQAAACAATKGVTAIGSFEVTPGVAGVPTPIAVGQSVGFVGSGSSSGSSIYSFQNDGQLQMLTPLATVPASGGFDDLLLLGLSETLIAAHQAGLYACSIAQPDSCTPLNESVTGLVHWRGDPPFNSASFMVDYLGVRKTDGFVVMGGSMSSPQASLFHPSDAGTEAFDLAVNGSKIALTTYTPPRLWTGTLSPPVADMAEADLGGTPSHLVVRNDGKILVALTLSNDATQEKLVRIDDVGPTDFGSGQFGNTRVRSPLAYDPACDTLFAVSGLLPQQLYACVGDLCDPVGDFCDIIGGIAPVAPDSPDAGSVFYVCIDEGMGGTRTGTVMRWGPPL